ncbi:hypothetical protein D3C80_1251400 [compost metagenome]
MMNIQQANFIARHFVRFHARNHVRIDTVSGIAYRHAHAIATFRHANCHHAFAFAWLDAVDDSVLNQGLNQQAWDDAVNLFVDIVDNRQLIAKTRLLDRDVVFNLIQLFFDINLLVVFKLNVVAQIAREIINQLTGGIWIHSNRRGNRIQRVKQEMGINFTL